MISFQITFQVNPTYRESFLAATLENMRITKDTEPDILRFDLYEFAEQPNTFLLTEVYKDQAARDAHLESDHFLRWKAVVTSSTEIFVSSSMLKLTALFEE